MKIGDLWGYITPDKDYHLFTAGREYAARVEMVRADSGEVTLLTVRDDRGHERYVSLPLGRCNHLRHFTAFKLPSGTPYADRRWADEEDYANRGTWNFVRSA